MNALQKEIVDTFFQTLEDIKTKEDFEVFFNNFLTPKELETFSKRLAIAYWLKKGRSYENIKNNVKVSSATIANVDKLMESKGFRLALKKMEAEEWANLWSEKIKNMKRAKTPPFDPKLAEDEAEELFD